MYCCDQPLCKPTSDLGRNEAFVSVSNMHAMPEELSVKEILLITVSGLKAEQILFTLTIVSPSSCHSCQSCVSELRQLQHATVGVGQYWYRQYWRIGPILQSRQYWYRQSYHQHKCGISPTLRDSI